MSKEVSNIFQPIKQSKILRTVTLFRQHLLLSAKRNGVLFPPRYSETPVYPQWNLVLFLRLFHRLFRQASLSPGESLGLQVESARITAGAGPRRAFTQSSVNTRGAHRLDKQ